MKAYCFDYEGKYAGSVEADICQLTEMKRAQQAQRKLKEGEAVIEKKFIFPSMSTEIEPPACELGFAPYFENGEWVIKEVIEKSLEDFSHKETPKEVTYRELREAEYPDMYGFLDAMVKINSGDKDLKAEGKLQLDDYVKKCLEVKAKFPKPVDEVGE